MRQIMERLPAAMKASTLEAALAEDVQAAARGDRQAYARLVDSTRNLVCSISLAIVRDLSGSEDIAQEVYLATWAGLSKLRNPDSFLPWLRQVTRNRAHDHVRARARSAAGDGEMLAALPDPTPDSLHQLVGFEESRILVEALDALPDESREVMLLFYREGKSAAQVGRLLGMREEAVKKRLSRARAVLRLATAERFGDLAESTAAGPGFVRVVVAGLPATGPGMAAGSKVAASKIGALLGGAAMGIAMGALGVLVGAHLQARQAFDNEERRGIWRLSMVNLLGVVGFGSLVSWAGAHNLAWLAVAAYCALVALLGYTTQSWLPRVISRRLAWELDRDPAAAARHRRRRIVRFLGLLIGALCGAAGLLSGLR